jgi:hydrogenase nickel incorporation protein HypA/HybF
MHEYSLTQAILQTALQHAQQASAAKLARVNLIIGEYCDEHEESIRFYWDDLAKGTMAQGAELHFERVPAELKCLDCGHAFHPTEEACLCPACSSRRLRLLSGDDVRLESIEIE